MKRFVILIILCQVTFNLFSQSRKDLPSIEIVGSAKVLVSPDVGVLVIQITSMSMDFSQAIVKLNEKTRDISKQIIGLGFSKREIKTKDFEIVVNRIYRREETIDSGYVARQSVNVEFENKKETITKILNAFSKSQTDFTLTFNFKLSETRRAKVQDELLKLSIIDAKAKAKLIAETSGVKIKRISDIDYGTEYYAGMREVREYGEYLEMADAMPADESIVGFTPSDLLFQDSVLVSWEIE